MIEHLQIVEQVQAATAGSAMEQERKSREIARRAAWRAGLQIGIFCALAFWFYAGTWIPTKDPKQNQLLRPRSDFMVFYASGILIRQSPDQLYNPEAQARAQRIATGLDISEKDIDFLPFAYPPIVALLYAPFTFVGYVWAYFMMVLLNLLFIGAVIWTLNKRLRFQEEKAHILTVCAWALMPVYYVLLQGQLSFLILLFYTLAVTDLRQGRVGRPGLWAGLVSLKPTLLPMLLVWFAARRYWRALAWAIAVAGTLTMMGLLLVGTSGTVGYVQMSSRMAGGDFYTRWAEGSYNLRAMLHFFGFGNVLWFLSLAALIGSVVWPRQKETGVADWDYCALILAVILGASHLRPQDLDLALIIVALVLARSNQPMPARHRWLLFLLVLSPAVALFAMVSPDGRPWPALQFLMIGLFIFFSSRRNLPHTAQLGQ